MTTVRRRYQVKVAGETTPVTVTPEGQNPDVQRVQIGAAAGIDVESLPDGQLRWFEEGKPVMARVDLTPAQAGTAARVWVSVSGHDIEVEVEDARRALGATLRVTRSRAAAGPIAVRTPMPGKVVKVFVQPGDEVTAGKALAVVEAMKMENEMQAPRAGRVVRVAVAEGTAVEAGAELVVLE